VSPARAAPFASRVAADGDSADAAVLIDIGVLVALLNADDGWHAASRRWLAGCSAKLHTVEAVLAETAFFLPPSLRPALAGLARASVLRIHTPDAAGHGRMSQLFEKYRDRDPDWADIALVWLAEQSGIRRIATLDVADFSVYRIQGRRHFEIEPLG
jgi:predicted nucleic acid-binding protein